MGTKITYKAERIVKYRYTCEKCDNTTQWYVNKTWMTAVSIKSADYRRFELNLERTSEELEKTAERAVISLERLTRMLKVILQKDGERFIADDPFLVEKYNEIFNGGAECPACKARQSWYPAFAFRPNKWKSARNHAIAPLIACGIIAILIVALNASYDIRFFVALSAHLLIIPFTLSIIAAFVGFFRTRRLSKHFDFPQAKSFIPHRPEVIWEEPMVEIVGYPIEDEVI